MRSDRSVAFPCRKSSARSRMAEGPAPAHGVDRFAGRPTSAREPNGEPPAHDPRVLCARAERGCSRLIRGAARRHSRPLVDPVAVDGPLGKRLEAFREDRNGLVRRILEWPRDPAVPLVGEGT